MDFKKRKINLLDEEYSQPRPQSSPSISSPAPEPQPSVARPKKKKRRGKRFKFSLFFILLIVIFTIIASSLADGNSSFLAGVRNSYLIRQITNIISSDDAYLRGEEDDRINFVLLGMGGPGHEGPYLTDTIIVASFKPSTKQAAMISLPRDMIVPLSSNDYRKINSIYTIGQNRDDNGGELVKEVIGRTLDMDIHYYAAVDFNGFVEIVDAIGGVEVDVEKSFTDYEFPTADYKYQVVSFESGVQKMDGITALRYARSRHGNNGEGSDFARIKRQQKILISLKDKATSFNTLINPKKITSIYSLFNKYTSTDLEPWEAVKMVHMAKGMDTQKIVGKSIDDRPGGYLKAGISVDGAYILQPVTGNFDQIRLLAEDIFTIEEVKDENARIVVQNGTDVPGLALKAVNHLSQMDYNIIRYGNAETQDKISTVIYNYTEDKPQTMSALEAIFQTKSESNAPLEFSANNVAAKWDIRDEEGNLENIDFLIVLGLDQNTRDDIEIVETIDPSLLNASTTTSTIELDEDEELEEE